MNLLSVAAAEELLNPVQPASDENVIEVTIYIYIYVFLSYISIIYCFNCNTLKNLL